MSPSPKKDYLLGLADEHFVKKLRYDFYKKIVKFMALWMGYLLHHNRKSKVLYYHDIGVQYTNMGTPFDQFIDHIRIIKERGFEIVTNVTNENNQVMIAFDDGWRGIYDNKQLFVDYGFFPTVFIAVNLIGAPGYMNEKEIKELYDLGVIFESHTWTHTGLHTHHGDSLIKETEYAKLKLEEMFNKHFDDICFPQGMFSEEAITACKKAGYKKYIHV